ncbi:hypothetical protein Kfla_1194 [Kribbella flavida DSM 17836]|uniref:Smu12A n=1 Tax=Kribbella flavida (strain DSM 17836 / JCM 10339 / NBRC 14399) TaxID=479435 RepID=D2Q2W6_KRIFD|nr:hypothetical protein [Kribbella flavida]ADB30297.1 hypothetical protein Kfla_1194 [Kribbella flavida DSM 17836]
MSTQVEDERVRGWLAGRLPQEWFDGEPEVSIDRDEILVVGTIPAPQQEGEVSAAARSAAEEGRIKQFREDTRERRIEIARELEHATRRKVAWGVRCGETRTVFTSLSAPVMTRLRQPERQVLDTLVDAGVARSRSDALGWCVKLVAQHSETWLKDLREAMEKVENVRRAGPDAQS